MALEFLGCARKALLLPGFNDMHSFESKTIHLPEKCTSKKGFSYSTTNRVRKILTFLRSA